MLGWETIPAVGFGRFSISPHGLMIAVGVLIATYLAARSTRLAGRDPEIMLSGATYGVVGAMVGARVAYVIGHASNFESPLDWFRVWEGGVSLIGGLLGAFAAAYVFLRRRKIAFFPMADLCAPWMGLGIAVGRIGDLMIGDHLGKETSGWWGWEYQGGELISPPPPIYSSLDGLLEPGMVVHQTALYDLAWSLVIFGILYFVSRKPRNVGLLFLSWAFLYACGRIVTDFTRVDKTWFGTGMTGSQLTTTAVALVVGATLMRYRGAPRRRKEQSAPPSTDGQLDTTT